jgi:hypothetical protein
MSVLGKVSVLSAIAVLTLAVPAAAQNLASPVNTTIQLPTVRIFNVRTAVSVPDGGTMSLGGVSSFSSGQTSRGVPGLRGPLFQNRAGGYSAGGSHASVKVRIISNREIGEDLMAEGERRAAIQELHDPNGTRAVQAKADFISRNIGRSRR